MHRRAGPSGNRGGAGWKAAALASCALALGGPARAADQAEPEPDAEALKNLTLEQLLQLPVYAPTKLAEPAQSATGSVELITRAQMDAFGWLTVNDVLYAMPGFYPCADFERTTVGTRGLYEPWGNNRLLLLFDGVPHNDPVTGTAYTWEPTPLFLAESVEVVRGPGASLYGSNAMNGMVAIHSVSAGEQPAVRGTIRAGTSGRRIYELLGTAQAPLASVVLGFSWDEFAGENRPSYDLSGRRDENGQLRQFAATEARASSFFLGKLDGRGPLAGFGLQLHHQTWDYQSRLGYILFAPDGPDSFEESRQIVTASYQTPSASEAWQQEYVLRVQRHNYLWNVRLVPGDMFASLPGGITEGVTYHLDEVFGRAQLSYGGRGWGRVVAGSEYSLLLYGGDQAHFLNVDLAGDPVDGFPPQLPGPAPVGPFLEGMQGRPLHRLGVFAEWVSAQYLGDRLSFTAGARYDRRFFQYLDVFSPGRELRDLAFQQLSPRLTALFTPIPALTVRGTMGWAFRDPAADELFASNSLLALGGVGRLRPESSTTYELGLAWQALKALRVQATGFLLQFRDQIGYSSESITLNLYSRTTAGMEAELLAGTGLGGLGYLNGFASYSWNALVDESVSDPAFTSQADRLTWAPGHTAKAGLSWSYQRVNLALQARFQGPVLRKDSDMLDPENLSLRGAAVDPWLSVNATVGVELVPGVTLRAKGSNLFDAQGKLVKIQDAPFDYPIPGRQLWAGVELRM
ncbi:MAG TPA: TonB-dependent receptor [Myxococcales bacterium]|jgi:iron complex outermembrane receptor protein|nr:TonB-dependent receptor [Myxococcales bacterium]